MICYYGMFPIFLLLLLLLNLFRHKVFSLTAIIQYKNQNPSKKMMEGGRRERNGNRDEDEYGKTHKLSNKNDKPGKVIKNLDFYQTQGRRISRCVRISFILINHYVTHLVGCLITTHTPGT